MIQEAEPQPQKWRLKTCAGNRLLDKGGRALGTKSSKQKRRIERVPVDLIVEATFLATCKCSEHADKAILSALVAEKEDESTSRVHVFASTSHKRRGFNLTSISFCLCIQKQCVSHSGLSDAHSRSKCRNTSGTNLPTSMIDMFFPIHVRTPCPN